MQAEAWLVAVVHRSAVAGILHNMLLTLECTPRFRMLTSRCSAPFGQLAERGRDPFTVSEWARGFSD